MSIGIRWMWAFLDARVPDAPASEAFWATVTRTTVSPRRGAHGEFATLVPAEGDPWVKVQEVGGVGGLHLDLDVEDVQGAAEAATDLGATVLGRLDDTVVVMHSPGGFTFCLTTWRGTSSQVREGPDLVDQVCLDIPAVHHDAERGFWERLTGWEHRPGVRAETFSYLVRPPQLPLRILLQRVGHSGSVTGHIDIACADRAATTVTHLAAGASVVEEHALWTVMRDPVGRTYSLTDRLPVTGTLPD